MDQKTQGVGAGIVREWLQRYRQTLAQIEEDEEKLIRMTNRMEQVSSPQLTDMPRNPSPERDKFSIAIASKDRLESKIRGQLEFISETRIVVEKLLTLCNSKEASTIQMYYLAGMEWREIVPYMFAAEECEDNARCLQNLYRYRRGGVAKIAAALSESDGSSIPSLLDVAGGNLKKYL